MKSIYSVILALTYFHKRNEIIKNVFGLHHSTYPWTIQRPPPSKLCVSNQLMLFPFYITHILSLSKHCIFQISKSANIVWYHLQLGFLFHSILHFWNPLEDPLEEGMAPHSSILAWRTPWTEEPSRLHTVHGVTKSRTRLSDFTFPFFLLTV